MSGVRNISVTELETLLQKEEVRLLDVRTDAEVAQGKIPRGELLPLHLVPLRMSELDKNATTVFYCRSGGRSAQAAAFVVANGFTDVYNLQGGIIAWANSGMQVSA